MASNDLFNGKCELCGKGDADYLYYKARGYDLICAECYLDRVRPPDGMVATIDTWKDRVLFRVDPLSYYDAISAYSWPYRRFHN